MHVHQTRNPENQRIAHSTHALLVLFFSSYWCRPVAFAVDRHRYQGKSGIEEAYNSCKFGIDANQAGIGPVRWLLSKSLQYPSR
jgi:hypothetical protein